jgi:hypothetical protein
MTRPGRKSKSLPYFYFSVRGNPKAEVGETKRPALRQVFKWENEDVLTAKFAVLF